MKTAITFLRGAGFLTFFLCGFWCRDAQGQGIDLDAAKREGELAFFSAMRAEDTDQMVKAFTKKYPFVKGSFYRAGGDPLLHPNVGKLFIDFLLSQEAANLLRSQQRIPARLDVEPLTERLNPKKLKLYPVNISIEKLDPRGFRRFFGVGE